MFTTYIKNLNDMVFSTSDSPQEQPGAGVLGRIGSWLSPWRAKSPASPTENVSPTSEQALKLELEGESEETVSSQGKAQQREGEQRELHSNPDPPVLHRVVFAREGEDATQPVIVVNAKTAEAAPRGAESVQIRKKRVGQGKESEESSSSHSVSGNPGKKAGHVTKLSPAHIQPQALSETQAQGGRKLQVYLEETSLVQCGIDSCAGQEVVRTKLPKSVKVAGATKPSLSSNSQEVSVTKRGQSKRTNARPTPGTGRALVGGSLKPHKDSQFEPQKEQTEADTMGRKNAARRKLRKNSAGDRGHSPHENRSESGETIPEGPAPGKQATSPGDKTANSLQDSSASSSPQNNPSSKTSLELGEGGTSCPDTSKEHDNFQDTNSVSEGSALCATDGSGEMEDEDSLYKVERKTETSASKRRSMKVSQSEVKFFTKNVRLNSIQSPGDNQATKSVLKTDEAKEKPGPEASTRHHDLKKTSEDFKPVPGRIADKISMFERPAGGVDKRFFQTPRSADASPVRKAHARLKASFEQSDQSSRPVDRQLKARSSSASPCRDRLETIKERAGTFMAALPPQPAVTGTSAQTPPQVASGAIKSHGLDKLDVKEQTRTNTMSKIALKPDGLDAVPPEGEITIPVEQPARVDNTVAVQTVDQSSKKEAVVAAKRPDEPEEMINNISPESKGPSRATSRSKRRKSKEHTTSTTPNGETTAINQDQDTAFVFHPPEDGQGSSLDGQSHKNIKVPVKQEEHSSVRKENSSRQELQPSVNKGEPDTAAWSDGTKSCVDKEAGGNRVLVTQEDGEASKGSREPPAPPSSLPLTKRKQEPPVHSRCEKVPSEEKHKGEIMETTKNDVGNTQERHKNPKRICHSKKEDKSDSSNQANQTGPTQKETVEKLSQSLSEEGKSSSERRGGAEGGDGKNAGESDERGTKSDQIALTAKSPGRAKSMLPAQHDGETEMENSRGGKAGGRNNEPVGGTKGDRKLLKAEERATREGTGTAPESAGKAAETETDSAHVEQMDNSPGDSRPHGANDAELSPEKPAAGATSAVEKETVEVNHVAPPLITAPADGAAEGDSSVEEPALISAPESVSNGGAGRADGEITSAVESAPSDSNMPGEGAIVPPGQPRNAEGQKGDIIATPPKGVGSMEPQPADSNLTGNSTAVELSPVARGDISQQPQPFAGKAEVSQGKPRQTPNLNKLIPGSAQPSPKKKLSFSWGKSQEDSDRQDAPSSWLDVDLPKQRLRVAAPKLNSSGSESNLLDTSGEFDDDDFVEKIKKLCAPFSLPPRKHNPLGPPQPPFALPAIKEDRYEKTFDPEEFKFGLRKPKYTLEAATSTLNKLHNMESKSGQKPFRASLSDRSFLLSSLDTLSRLKTPIKDEEEATEEKEEKVKMKSRLEGSCVLSSLTSSLMKGKKNGVQPQAEGTNSGEVSPSNAPQPRSPPLSQPPPPSPTSDQQSPALSQREEVPALLNDTGPPLPSFTDIKLPEYLEKYLPQEAPKPAPDVREQEQLNKVLGNMPTQPPAAGTEAPVRTSPGIHPAEPPSCPGKATLDLKDPAAGQPQHTLTQSKRTARGFHKRPGKIVLFERAQFSGQAYEIYRDMADATCLQLSALISVKVVRGCWVLYEKPDFQGRTIALEEGGIELDNVWAESGAGTEPQDASPMLIGSIRLAVWDYSIPCIDLFTEPEGRGRITSYHDDTIETGTFGIPLSTASIQVYSGVWLVFSDPGFQGMLAVLEKGEYPFPESWGFSSPFVGSLRPLKMGGFKVENASEIKAVVYEKPGFQGSCMEVDGNIFSFPESNDADPKKPKSAGSLKIIGGLWVGYSEPRFEGQQHILEEGEYWDGSDWGGSEGLKSLQPILSQDFFSPHLKMFRDRDFGGMDIDITVPVPNMEETGYGTKTQSLDVIGGVWVVFEEPGFCGESYVIERGLYGCPEDWGALQPRIASAMPVVLSDFETTAKFKVHLFSEPGFQGSSVVLEDSVASLEDGFCVASCKVRSGSWLAFEGADFSSRLYVLEEGSYPDLKSMGCVHGASIQSLQTVGFEFSLPSLTLFERCGLRGKRVVLTEGSVNLPLTGGCSRVQSVLVEGGIWVVHEGINYRGAQIVLRPGEVHDWYKFSSWLKIGSLRPLPQKQVHFRLRNRHSGLVMALAGDLDDIKMMRIQEMEENGELEQIWFYQNGSLHSKLLEEFCLGPSGSMVMAGSRVGLAPELDAQAHLWSLTSEGFLRYTPTHNLVLDIKGGHHYDKNLVILNTLDPSRQQQHWDVDVL